MAGARSISFFAVSSFYCATGVKLIKASIEKPRRKREKRWQEIKFAACRFRGEKREACVASPSGGRFILSSSRSEKRKILSVLVL